MGQGGKITLVNATDRDWKNTHQHSYQMNSWSFPDTIPSGTSVSVYVEWDQNIFHHTADDAGECNYTLEGTSQFFQVQARATNGFNLQVCLENIPSQGLRSGATVSLGWDHDGYVTFILSGSNGVYTSTGLNGQWMQNNLSMLGDRQLMQLCIPGSHDAGMSQMNGSTAFGYQCNTLTQSASVLDQLKMGARYFDIRPVISGGHFFTGHYGYISQISSWQGANGESIAQIIKDVNEFTATNKELVILNLSHDLNTDLGNNSYAPFTQTEWNNLFSQMSAIQNLYVVENNPNINLTQQTLNSFIGGNKAAVILVVEPSGNGISLGNYQGNGFFTTNNFNVYNSYSNTNDFGQMSSDQIAKMKAQRNSSNPSCYFLLSWTLTQDSTQATTCCLGTASSIIDLAKIANPRLADSLYPMVSSKCYPNIIYTDNIQGSNIAAMCMAVNTKVSQLANVMAMAE